MAFDKSAAPQKNRKRRKVCQFCVDKAEYIDYKDTVKLRKYLSERSKILPRPPAQQKNTRLQKQTGAFLYDCEPNQSVT